MPVSWKVKMSNVILYPLLKKTDFKIEDVDSITEEQIDSVSDHFTKQLVHQFKNLGLPESQAYFNDISFLSEIIKAVMYRPFHKYHFFQDVIDEVNEKLFDTNIDDEDEDEVR